ncbi:ankyrin repeat-containing protein BDA1-like [Telopea speciosissima]|uniref:ankyrin repeat-containing protein BDA1-like n=1 Tax=Telopea speciosissima TaxID=54955 RepID=UPI001CC5F85B|nr:ankyrin repeat-containing protein BDA1-like [Telopea speciosissima]
MAQNQIEEVYNSLMEAAKNGNKEMIEELYKLLGEHPSVLDKADTQFGENLLHVAAKHGNALLAAEIAILNPSLTKSLNQEGLSPLHIAAKKGHLDTVKKLLKVDKELCLFKGREMMVPLHCAAKSDVNLNNKKVIEELLSACPKCITALTTQNETAFHIAVKSGSSQNFEALVKWIKGQRGGYNILSWKDQDGNTILHLAASERKHKNLKIVKLLLRKKGYFVRKAVKINTMNNNGQTALDVINGSKLQPEQDEELGSKKVQGDEDKEKEVPNFLSFKVDKDISSEVRNALLVILILIVTVTYTTGINPPGGLWQDDGISNSSQKQHTAGTSIWFDKNPDSFQLLMLCNYAGFLVSVVLIFNLTEGYTLRGPILLALLFMLITYALSIRLLFLSDGALAVLINGIILIVPLPVALVLLVATANWIWDIKP